MKIIKTASGKYKLTKQTWEDIGKKAGWMKVAATEEELQKSIGENGLCPVCGEKVAITGLTTDGRLIGSCKDAFPFEKWNVTVWDLLDDWGKEGYGIALISPDDKVVDPYIDASDYPDIILDKSGNGAKVISGDYKGYYIVFHSGQLEDKVGQEWFPESISKMPREAQFNVKMMPGQELHSEAASKTYRDNDRTLEISGHPVLDPHFTYMATIKDESGSVESVLTEATLSEIYKWGKEHNFDIKEEQRKTAQWIPQWKKDEYPNAFKYFINLDERGEFYADVRNPEGETVFEIKGGEIFEDGWMKYKDDMAGLKEYLVHLGVMNEDQELFKMDPSLERTAQLTPPKMMPGQEPYSEDEYKKLTDMVEEAAEGDPGEEAEVLEETIDTIPFKLIDGIKVVNIIHLLSKIGGDMQSYEENSARVIKWAKEHDADYYGQTRDSFNVLEAVQQAKRNKKDIVIVEDLS